MRINSDKGFTIVSTPSSFMPMDRRTFVVISPPDGFESNALQFIPTPPRHDVIDGPGPQKNNDLIVKPNVSARVTDNTPIPTNSHINNKHR